MILNPNLYVKVKVDGQIVGSIQSAKIETSANEPKDIGLVYAPYIPITRELNASFSLQSIFEESITFKYKKKTFAIYSKNKKLAQKLVKLTKKEWITYLQYEDEGIVQLVKCLLKMKYEESRGNEHLCFFSDEVIKDLEKEAAKQISAEIDKDLLDSFNIMSKKELYKKYLGFTDEQYENFLKERDKDNGKK
jgi:hypothetical protein